MNVWNNLDPKPYVYLIICAISSVQFNDIFKMFIISYRIMNNALKSPLFNALELNKWNIFY